MLAVELPVGLENPLDRLYEVRRRMRALKQSYEPSVTLGLLAALGYAPKVVQDRLFDLLLSRATAVMTNVPGPQQPLYLAGSELKQIICWGPQAHDIGMGVSILSFNGRVQFGLITDAAMVPDPQAIIARFRARVREAPLPRADAVMGRGRGAGEFLNLILGRKRKLLEAFVAHIDGCAILFAPTSPAATAVCEPRPSSGVRRPAPLVR